jgi:hypothetical protein
MSLPPLQAPMNTKVNTAPGTVTFVDTTGGGVKKLMEVDFAIDKVEAKGRSIEGRVERAYYVDMFLLIIGDERVQPATAREIAERHEEKLLMLGPVLESLHDEKLGPFIEIAFAYMLRAGMIPPPPREMSGMPLVVQFVSLLAQAQRLVGLNSIDRLLGTVLNVAAAMPELATRMSDKLDVDQMMDVYADTLGTDPTLIVSDDQVALIREDRAAQVQQMQAVEAAPQLAAAAKDAKDAAPVQI